MPKFSQNKKIAISALALFTVSFSTMIFFLGEKINPSVKTDVMEAGSVDSESVKTIEGGIQFKTDVEGVITEASDDFCKIFGTDCSAMIKNKFFNYVNREDMPEMASVYGKLAQNGQQMNTIGPIRVLGANKEEKFLLLNASPLLDAQGKVMSIKFTANDITNKVQDVSKPQSPQTGNDQITTPIVDQKKAWLDSMYPKIKDVQDPLAKLAMKVSYVMP